MSTVINTNMEAVRTLGILNKNNVGLNKALTRISTGLKINSAADNASGWASSEKMRERIRALDQVNQNIQNDNAMVKTAEGGLANTIEILRTMKERALNAANDSNKDTDRAIIQKELNSLADQIDANANVKYNGKTLINGSTFKSGETGVGLRGVFVLTGVGEAVGSGTLTSEVGGLGLVSSDIFTVSWIKNGTFGSTTGEVGSNSLTQLLAAEIGNGGEIGVTWVTAGGEVGNVKGVDGLAFKSPFKGYAFYTNDSGYKNDFSYLNIEITGRDGNSKDVINATLNNGWVNVQSAQDEGKGTPLSFRIGEDTSMEVSFGNMSSTALGLRGAEDGRVISVTSKESAKAAVGAFDTALNRALEEQTKIGALENRLGYTADNIATATENVKASDSAVRDADLAEEMSNFMRLNILAQASQLMLAQATQNPASVLNLLNP